MSEERPLRRVRAPPRIEFVSPPPRYNAAKFPANGARSERCATRLPPQSAPNVDGDTFSEAVGESGRCKKGPIGPFPTAPKQAHDIPEWPPEQVPRDPTRTRGALRFSKEIEKRERDTPAPNGARAKQPRLKPHALFAGDQRIPQKIRRGGKGVRAREEAPPIPAPDRSPGSRIWWSSVHALPWSPGRVIFVWKFPFPTPSPTPPHREDGWRR